VSAAVVRRLAAEFTGTGLLVAIVVGSGIAATISPARPDCGC
jgi:glycerol uptake facilitator-like aquaporin